MRKQNQNCKYCNKTLSIGERFWHESSCALNPKFEHCKGCKYLKRKNLIIKTCLMHSYHTENCPHKIVAVEREREVSYGN